MGEKAPADASDLLGSPLSFILTLGSSSDGVGMASTTPKWSVHVDAEGRQYFVNNESSQSQWEMPEGFEVIENELVPIAPVEAQQEMEMVDISKQAPTLAEPVESDAIKPQHIDLHMEMEDEEGNPIVELMPGVKSEYQILGTNTQVVNVRLEPGEQVFCEPGSLIQMTPDVLVRTHCHCSLERYWSGESQFATEFVNESDSQQLVGLTPTIPSSKVLPVDMSDPWINGILHCKRDAWMATIGKTEITFSTDFRLATCCFGGQGLSRQQIVGEKAVVFLVGGGTIMRRELKKHEKVVIDDQTLLAWTGTVNYYSRTAFERCWDWFFDASGEGTFNFAMTGGSEGGVMYLQSMPYEKYKDSITGGSLI